MIGSIFTQYQQKVNNISGSFIGFKENISGALWIQCSITPLSSQFVTPTLPVEQTKFSITSFNVLSGGRVAGIDNHEHKPLHQHTSGNEINLSGTHTLGTIGSYAFLEFFR